MSSPDVSRPWAHAHRQLSEGRLFPTQRWTEGRESGELRTLLMKEVLGQGIGQLTCFDGSCVLRNFTCL